MQAGSIKSPGKRVAVTSNQTGGQRELLFVQRADRMLTAGIYMAPYSITSRLPRIPTSAGQWWHRSKLTHSTWSSCPIPSPQAPSPPSQPPGLAATHLFWELTTLRAKHITNLKGTHSVGAHFYLPFNAWLCVGFDSCVRDEKQINNQKLNTGENKQTNKNNKNSNTFLSVCLQVRGGKCM